MNCVRGSCVYLLLSKKSVRAKRADGHRIAGHGPAAAELIFVALEGFARVSESEILGDV